MRTFLFGAVVGATAMWMLSNQFRARFGGTVDAVVDRGLGVLDTVDEAVAGLRERLNALTVEPRAAEARRERWDLPAAGGTA